MKPLLFVLALALLGGCASNAPKHDPMMSFNREVHQFNSDFDKTFVKPVAKVYDKITPDPIDKGITNFFSNLDDITVIINDLLQLKLKQAASDTGRFMVNSTVGVLGFLDPATKIGLVKHHEDFGQTLGRWGVPSGPYLVLPVLGPSSLRDFPGKMVDMFLLDVRKHASTDKTQDWIRASRGVELLDMRSDLLEAEKILGTAATDPYAFMRDSYLQQREVLVRDGASDPSEEISDKELFGP